MSAVYLQELAPDPIMRAALDTVSWACIHGRNRSLSDECDKTEFNELMESIHEVPRMLMSWGADRLPEIRNHLGCFPYERFPGAPNLVAYFDARLASYTKAEQNRST